MLEAFRRWLADPVHMDIYLFFALAVMFAPLIALSWWYHGSTRRSPGGRALMREQADNPAVNSPIFLLRNLATAWRMNRRVMSGAYGGDTRRRQIRLYMFLALWLAACVIVFGLLIWASPAPAG